MKEGMKMIPTGELYIQKCQELGAGFSPDAHLGGKQTTFLMKFGTTLVAPPRYEAVKGTSRQAGSQRFLEISWWIWSLGTFWRSGHGNKDLSRCQDVGRDQRKIHGGLKEAERPMVLM